MAKPRELQTIVRLYKEQTGIREVDHHEVAKWAAVNGWDMPAPVDPFTRFAQDLSRAARQEVRRDATTGKPYRANHVIVTKRGDVQLHLWIDIDEAQRSQMQASAVLRREQMVGDGLQLSLDLDHWNSINPAEESIELPMDLTDDIEWRKNAPEEDEEAS